MNKSFRIIFDELKFITQYLRFNLNKVYAIMEHHSRRIKVMKKYVDDMFLLLPKESIKEILLLCNSVEDRMQFTFERETSNSIPFLDMTVFHDEDKRSFFTKWHRKPVSSCRLHSFKSIHPTNQKVSTAYGLIDRVNRPSRPPTILSKEQKTFDENAYGKRLPPATRETPN